MLLRDIEAIALNRCNALGIAEPTVENERLCLRLDKLLLKWQILHELVYERLRLDLDLCDPNSLAELDYWLHSYIDRDYIRNWRRTRRELRFTIRESNDIGVLNSIVCAALKSAGVPIPRLCKTRSPFGRPRATASFSLGSVGFHFEMVNAQLKLHSLSSVHYSDEQRVCEMIARPLSAYSAWTNRSLSTDPMVI